MHHLQLSVSNGGVALVVLLVASTDAESSTTVGLVGRLVGLDIARAAESSSRVQEVVATLNDEATSTRSDGGGSNTTH